MKILETIFVVLLFLSLILVRPASSNSVPVQYSPIQQIINTATEGSTVTIPPGVYYGLFKLNKSLTLIGTNVVIDANNSRVGVIISALNVVFQGFTVKNALRFGDGSIPEELKELWMTPEMEGVGIYVYYAKYVNISRVTITDCYAGIGFWQAFGPIPNYVINSTITRTLWAVMLERSHIAIFNSMMQDGLRVYTDGAGRIQTGGGGILISDYSILNLTYSTLQNINWAINIMLHAYFSYIRFNNFINNTHQVYIAPLAQREVANWTGNFWSDYNGVDTNLDGVGDTPYVIDAFNQDDKPLMTDPHFEQSKPRSGGGGGGMRHYIV